MNNERNYTNCFENTLERKSHEGTAYRISPLQVAGKAFTVTWQSDILGEVI